MDIEKTAQANLVITPHEGAALEVGVPSETQFSANETGGAPSEIHIAANKTDDKPGETQMVSNKTDDATTKNALVHDFSLPVVAPHDYKLRWNKDSIQFETVSGMRHLDWKYLKQATINLNPYISLKDRTAEFTDCGGTTYKMPLMYLADRAELVGLIDAIKYNSTAKMIGTEEENYDQLHHSIIKLWTYTDSGEQQTAEDRKHSKRIVNLVIILFAFAWIAYFILSLGHNTYALQGNAYFIVQLFKLIPLALIPLYAKLMPISHIRSTPLELTFEAIVANNPVVKKKLFWYNIVSVDLSPAKPNQRATERELYFTYSKGKKYGIKLEKIASAQAWTRLLTEISTRTGLSVEHLDPNVFDHINPDRKDPTYTQLWLDSLRAPARREKLIPLAAGASLQDGKYVLEHKLGAGGQGSAYLARCNDGTKVVLKEYILPIFVDAKVRRKALENFENEARMLQQLDSPLIVKLQDFFIEDHRGYLALEYIDGPNLRDYVRNSGVLSEEKAIAFAISMCDILTVLHSQSPPIIHRDFTPDNIILCGDSIKVIDFMVAQRNDEADSATATVVGKHAYLPPEQFRGKATTQSDVYALGCSLFYLLTGDDPEPLSESHPILVRDTISGALDEVVSKATAPEAADRFQSASALKQALVNLIDVIPQAS